MLNLGCHLRRLARPVAIAVIALLGLLLPATAAVSLTQAGRAPAQAAAAVAAPSAFSSPERSKGVFATATRAGARRHDGRSAQTGPASSGSVAGALGFSLLAGLSLLLLAAGLAPRSSRRKPCARRRCGVLILRAGSDLRSP